MRFKELADNPNLISGIHNYCDRWCERCSYTARCAVYAMEEADPDNDPSSRDLNNAAFWQKLATIFEETKEMISEWAEKNGVDLGEEELAPNEELLEQQREETRSHPLVLAAEKYAFDVTECFDKESSQVEVISDESPRTQDTEATHSDVIQLEKLRSGMEEEFPNARDFIRPGFDEPTLDLLQ